MWSGTGAAARAPSGTPRNRTQSSFQSVLPAVNADTPAAEPPRLAELTARDFRNFAELALSVPRAGAVLVGDNGQGKSNLLEAVGYLGTLRSIRNARDRDVVRHGATTAHLRATVAGPAARELSIGIERSSGRKKIVADGVDVARQLDVLGTLTSVSWSPSDVALVAGGPGERRRYLDVMLSLGSRSYIHALRRYRAALERRNATLRASARHRGAAHAVAAWEPALAESGGALVHARREWVDAHAVEFARVCAAIGERAEASVEYGGDAVAATDPVAALAKSLEQNRAADLVRGATSVGPHRDDLAIQLDGRDARAFGSAGQQRSAAIALRLLEARTLRGNDAGHPVLLLDDPFAELDARRTSCTLEVLADELVGQVLLAVPRAADIPAHFQGLARLRVCAGTVSP